MLIRDTFHRPDDLRRWTQAGWIVAAALLLLEIGKLALLESAGPAPLRDDAAIYWGLGTQVAQGDVWMTENPIGYRTPGYPWLLGALQAVCGDSSWRVVSVLQYAAVALTTGLTGWWVLQLSGSIWLVNLALAVRCLSLASASYASVMMTESWYVPLFLATLMVATSYREAAVWKRWGGMGVLWALALLIRPANAGMVPVLGLAAVVEAWPVAGWPARFKAFGQRCGLLAVIGLALIGPWCLRNLRIFGQPNPVIFVGREVWMSIYGPGRPVGPMLPKSPEAHRIWSALEQAGHLDDWRINWSVSHALTSQGASDAEADNLMKQVAWQGFRSDSVRAVVRSLWRQVDLWRTCYARHLALYGDDVSTETSPAGQVPWGTPELRARRAHLLDHAPENFLLVIELGSLLGLFGTLGLLTLPRTWQRGVLLTATLASMGLLSGALDIPNYRLRMILEPVLITGGVVGCWCWGTILRRGLDVTWRQHAESV